VYALAALTLISQPIYAFGTKPDLEKQEAGIKTMDSAFAIDSHFISNINESWRPNVDYDSRIQLWKGSSDKNSDKHDCSLLVYAVKSKDKGAVIQNPTPNLVEAMLKIDGQVPAKMNVMHTTDVKINQVVNSRFELSTFNYEEKYKKGDSGGSPEGNTAIAIITLPAVMLKDAVTPPIFKTKSVYNLVAEKSANDIFTKITIKSDEVNAKPGKRETSCYNVKRADYKPVSWDEARLAQEKFESKSDSVASQNVSVKDNKRDIKEMDSEREPSSVIDTTNKSK
jgi:hypothetical protein